MSQRTVLAELLGLRGVVIDLVEREPDGSWTVHVTSAPGQEVCCPECGAASGRRKDLAAQTVRHLVIVPMDVMWHKQRWLCRNMSCGRADFVESGPLAEPGAEISAHARVVMGHLVGDWLVPVDRVAESAGVSWESVHEAFVAVAAGAGITVIDTKTGTASPGGTETSGTETVTGEDEEIEAAARPQRSVSGTLPAVEVLGIDDHRRGRALFHKDLVTGTWTVDAERWQSVFVDSAGGHGLLGQVEGRTSLDVRAWLDAQDPVWLAGIRYVTIDMSSVYKAAVRAALPGARLIVDLFHVVQLANKMVSDVRRRVTFEHYGRRGRSGDLEYQLKSVLLRGSERLSKRRRQEVLCTLADLGGGAARQLGAAWRAKELLRDLVKLSPNRTGVLPSRHQVSDTLEKFFTFCATIGQSVPEIVTLAETVSLWRAEIARGVLTGHTNAAAEGVNRLVKLVYRSGFGLRNVINQQRRSRYAASRSTRPEWLHTVTSKESQCVAA